MANVVGVVTPVKKFTQELDNKFSDMYKTKVYQISNEQKTGMSAKYNEGIRQILETGPRISEDAWVIFTHDDVNLISDLGNTLQQLDVMTSKQASIAAVAGATKVPPLYPGCWWHGLLTAEFRGSGAVIHKTPGCDDVYHIESYGPYPQQVAAIDGLWFAITTKSLNDNRLRFDENTFDGYHYYDADFCATARKFDHSIWISGTLVLHHAWGKGAEDPEFTKYQKRFISKWQKDLANYKKLPKSTSCRFIETTGAYTSSYEPQSYA